MSRKINSNIWGPDILITNPEDVLKTLVVDSFSLSEPSPSSIDAEVKQPKRRALRLTPRRRQILRQYLEEVQAQPGKYGKVDGNAWTKALLDRFGEPKGNARLVTQFDVKHWLKTPELIQFHKRARDADTLSSDFDFTPKSPTNFTMTPSNIFSSGNEDEEEKIQAAKESLQKTGHTETTRFVNGFEQPNQVSEETNKKQFLSNENTNEDKELEYRFHSQQTQYPSMNDEGYETQLLVPQWQKGNQMLDKNKDTGIDLKIKSNGILVHVPSMSNATSFFLVPTAWNATMLLPSNAEALVPTATSTNAEAYNSTLTPASTEDLDLDMSNRSIIAGSSGTVSTEDSVNIDNDNDNYFYRDLGEPFNSSSGEMWNLGTGFDLLSYQEPLDLSIRDECSDILVNSTDRNNNQPELERFKENMVYYNYQ